MEHHETTICELRPWDCLCGKTITFHEKTWHTSSECPERIIICTECGQEMAEADFLEHNIDVCPKRPWTCGCGETVPFQQKEDHQIFKCQDPLKLCLNGCGFQGRRFARTLHENDDCVLRLVMCDCGDAIPARELVSHQQSSCDCRETKCPVCSTAVKAKDIRRHVSTSCEQRIVNCRQNCGQALRQSKLEDHEKNACVKRLVACGLCGRQLPFRTLNAHTISMCKVIPCPQCGTVLREVDLPRHSEIHCTNKPVLCARCNNKIPSQNLEDHEKLECPARIQTCEACQEVMHASLLSKHLEELCLARIVKCKQGCGASMKYKDAALHENALCPVGSWVCQCGEIVRTFQKKRHLKQCQTFIHAWEALLGNLLTSFGKESVKRRLSKIREYIKTSTGVALCALAETGGDVKHAVIKMREKSFSEDMKLVSDICGVERFIVTKKKSKRPTVHEHKEESKELTIEDLTPSPDRNTASRSLPSIPESPEIETLGTSVPESLELQVETLGTSEIISQSVSPSSNKTEPCHDCQAMVTAGTMKQHILNDCTAHTFLCQKGCGMKVNNGTQGLHETQLCPMLTWGTAQKQKEEGKELTIDDLTPNPDKLAAFRSLAAIPESFELETLETSERISQNLSLQSNRTELCEDCHEMVPAGTFKHHILDDCPSHTFLCRKGCGMKVNQNTQSLHETQLCPMLSWTCTCGMPVELFQRKKHLTQCPPFIQSWKALLKILVDSFGKEILQQAIKQVGGRQKIAPAVVMCALAENHGDTNLAIQKLQSKPYLDEMNLVSEICGVDHFVRPRSHQNLSSPNPTKVKKQTRETELTHLEVQLMDNLAQTEPIPAPRKASVELGQCGDCFKLVSDVMLLQHLKEECPAHTFLCGKGCGLRIPNRDRAVHEMQNCRTSIQTCRCGVQVALSQRSIHLSHCTAFSECWKLMLKELVDSIEKQALQKSLSKVVTTTTITPAIALCALAENHGDVEITIQKLHSQLYCEEMKLAADFCGVEQLVSVRKKTKRLPSVKSKAPEPIEEVLDTNKSTSSCEFALLQTNEQVMKEENFMHQSENAHSLKFSGQAITEIDQDVQENRSGSTTVGLWECVCGDSIQVQHKEAHLRNCNILIDWWKESMKGLVQSLSKETIQHSVSKLVKREKIPPDIAFCALAECSGDSKQAASKLRQTSYLEELILISEICSVQQYISVRKHSGNKKKAQDVSIQNERKMDVDPHEVNKQQIEHKDIVSLVETSVHTEGNEPLNIKAEKNVVALETCSDCHCIIQAGSLVKHRAEACMIRTVLCRKGCGQTIMYKDQKVHETQLCQMLPWTCQCGGSFQLSRRKEHLRDCQFFVDCWENMLVALLDSIGKEQIQKRIASMLSSRNTPPGMALCALAESAGDAQAAIQKLRCKEYCEEMKFVGEVCRIERLICARKQVKKRKLLPKSLQQGVSPNACEKEKVHRSYDTSAVKIFDSTGVKEQESGSDDEM